MTDMHVLERIHDGIMECAAVTPGNAWRGREHEIQMRWQDMNDQTACPPRYQRALERYSAALGFPVSYVAGIDGDLTSGPYGVTSTPTPAGRLEGGVPRVELDARMSPASLFRVGVHEMVHATISAGCTDQDNERRTGDLEVMLEEVLAESVAGMITGHLGVTDGKFSVRQLATMANNAGVPVRRLMAMTRPVSIAYATAILDGLGLAVPVS